MPKPDQRAGSCKRLLRNVTLVYAPPNAGSLVSEVVSDLSRSQKFISPKYFYDQTGSKLFERISELPEYYLTRAERKIMDEHLDEMAELLGHRVSIIEYGSGSSRKTRVLLERLKRQAVYVPVDISEQHLLESARQLRSEFADLEVLPVVADFTKRFALPSPTVMPLRNIVYFPGSTIGNFTHAAAADLLEVMYHEAGENGAMLIGVDLQKDPRIIERAYNDRAGVTAEFNLNMLRHLNREYGSDFDLNCWSHEAQYNEAEGRIELRLINVTVQTVHIGQTQVIIDEGEGILTEYSHKYDEAAFGEMSGEAGFEVQSVWKDPDNLFSIQLLNRPG